MKKTTVIIITETKQANSTGWSTEVLGKLTKGMKEIVLEDFLKDVKIDRIKIDLVES